MPFRIQGKAFSLTYPQCTATKEQALEHLLTLAPSYCLVSAEQHQDGSPHLHAAITFEIRKDIRNERHFDFLGFHPNIQKTRNPADWIKYCKKDGQFVEHGNAPKTKRSWAEAWECTTKEEALQTIQEISPRDAILNMDRIDSWVTKRFKPALPEYTSEFTFESIPTTIQQWIDQLGERRPKSLILWGPSRTGKTELARSFGRHMYFNGMFNIDDWDPEAKYAIFDDWFDWTKFPLYKSWIGAQQQFVASDKYRGKRTFQWGKPCIIISNSYPSFPDDDWVRANSFVLHVINPLF